MAKTLMMARSQRMKNNKHVDKYKHSILDGVVELNICFFFPGNSTCLDQKRIKNAGTAIPKKNANVLE